jgi:hypothetical protein
MTDERFAAYEAKCACEARLRAEILPRNTGVLFDALAAAGIAVVTVTFDGCGDSGQFEAPSGFGARQRAARPARHPDHREVPRDNQDENAPSD